ncbi:MULTISPECIES: dTDP-L-rhamnose 4-epimerase [Paraburkholderia]|uniref:dTDP-L-rhamnose 4-epimerase n=1 Tax=Paraburkholderia madseniana TaxID=2599607 RepID=A0AAP5EU23_9BURK|nr:MULTISPECIES: dTDP-L-rhamnose 4-epimerase [Paraburkholderia]MCX4151929.1 dTDP-L-rhamnose 4-epimerase [Paraburkholderia madseniana]MDN7154856.1 dTDP-L-rhamnose 4-epimerase [Paraburkholderia sp. WS6]MDQ6413739.1 dTDP-L-rhamnose 4-epimerase [Paraburkholderia madseniana]
MMDAELSLVDGKNVLVTGGAGFIGCAISKRLAPRAGRYVVVDNLHPQIHAQPVRPAALDARAELVVADVTEAATWDALLSDFKPQIIVHLAAETGTGQSLTEASRHALVNVVGTTRLTDALTKHGVVVEHILLTGSRAVYGEGAWQSDDGQIVYPGQRGRAQLEAAQWDFPGMAMLPSRADRTEPRPTSVYGATKLAQEQVLRAWALATKIPLSILRLQNVYGPGQSLTNSYTGIVALFSRLAREKKVIPLYEDGKVTRDFVSIDDVADAIVAMLERQPQPLSILDIGSGAAASILDMARIVAAHYGAPEPTITGAFRDGDVRHAACDLSVSLGQLDWKPQWSLERGVAELQNWIAQELDRKN